MPPALSSSSASKASTTVKFENERLPTTSDKEERSICFNSLMYCTTNFPPTRCNFGQSNRTRLSFLFALVPSSISPVHTSNWGRVISSKLLLSMYNLLIRFNIGSDKVCTQLEFIIISPAFSNFGISIFIFVAISLRLSCVPIIIAPTSRKFSKPDRLFPV